MCETTWDHRGNPEEGPREISFFVFAQCAFAGGEGVLGGGPRENSMSISNPNLELWPKN